MSPKFAKSAALVLCWGLVLGLTLSISRIPGQWGHGICGPWGCGPPLQSLVACHVSWLVILLPLVFIGKRVLSPAGQRIAGRAYFVAGAFGVIGMGVYERLTWYATAGESYRRYFWHRVGFSVVTEIDLPIIELLITGIVSLLFIPRTAVTKLDRSADLASADNGQFEPS